MVSDNVGKRIMGGMCKMCGKLTVNDFFCRKKCREVYHHKDTESI